MNNLLHIPKDILELITNKLDAIDFMNFYATDRDRFNKYYEFWFRRGKRDFPYANIKDYIEYRKFFKVTHIVANQITNYLLGFLENSIIEKSYKEQLLKVCFNFLGKTDPQHSDIYYGSVTDPPNIYNFHGLMEKNEPKLLGYINLGSFFSIILDREYTLYDDIKDYCIDFLKVAYNIE